MSNAVGNSSLLGKFAFAYLLMVVYGSLVPLDWNGLAFDTAWQRFQQVPYLNLGVGSRADWVANIVLYVPLGFLLCGWLVGESRRAFVKGLGIGLSMLICATCAVVVEFTQEFFPPRTVSLNDLYAETIGSAIGIAAWGAAGVRLQRLVRAVFRGGSTARNSVLFSYALVYLALSAFPYDFLLSAEEWRAHLDSGKVGWFFANNCGGHCVLKLLPEMLAVAPFGVLMTVLFGAARRASLVGAGFAGVMLGAGIEGVQLAMDSGVSQGASVLTRGLGVGLGAWVTRVWPQFDPVRYRHLVRPTIVLAALPYLLALTWLSRWYSGGWLSLGAALERLPGIHFLPFYYHYYTSEAVALVSLLYQFGLYLPIGLAAWTWRWVDRTQERDLALVAPVALGVTVSACMEASKLFLGAEHPDPTNVLIAVASVMSGYHLLNLIGAGARSPASSLSPIVGGGLAADGATAVKNQQRPAWVWVVAISLLGAAATAEMTNPLGLLAGTALVAYVIFLWWRPALWMVCVLAFLPLLDLTPWSGRLFWTDFDTLLLATLAVAYIRLPLASGPAANLPTGAKVLLALFGVSSVISLVNGLLPLAPLDSDAFSHYTSPYNALRAAKPFLFALAFLPLLLHEWGDANRASSRMALGATLGLVVEIIVILWERVTFSGLFNFETDYRITGTFPSMHVGGAYVEGYLVVTLPFVILWAWQRRQFASTVFAAALYAGGAYGVMVTFSRGGQVAFVLATLVALAGYVFVATRERARRQVGVFALVGVCAAVSLVAWPIFSGKYSQARLAASGQDLMTRAAHWVDAIDMLRSRGDTALGAGIGAYPAAYFWGSSEPKRPSTYSFQSNGSDTFLRMGSGDTLYVEQLIAVEPNQRYSLVLEGRSPDTGSTVAVSVCEKALLYSFACEHNQFQLVGAKSDWQRFEVAFETSRFGPPGSLFPRPVKISIFNAQAATVFDLRKIALTDTAAGNLVRNGNFAEGMHHWFFSTDNQLPWHIENLFVHVFFEQGAVGLACFLGIAAYVLARLLRRSWRGDPMSVAMLASLSGFLTLGLLNTLVDETRIGFLFYFIVLSAVLMPIGGATARTPEGDGYGAKKGCVWAMLFNLAGVNPALVAVSHRPGIESCRRASNNALDA